MEQGDFSGGEEAERETRPERSAVGNINPKAVPVVEPLDESIVEEGDNLFQAWQLTTVGVAGKLEMHSMARGCGGQFWLVRQQDDGFTRRGMLQGSLHIGRRAVVEHSSRVSHASQYQMSRAGQHVFVVQETDAKPAEVALPGIVPGK